ncbi:MAG: DUF5110 domain-containing protein [Clostridiales bacterium]|nr:DUF5110 domain-containing protein [Clostridiales bacterium]
MNETVVGSKPILHVEQVAQNIVHVSYGPNSQLPAQSDLIDPRWRPDPAQEPVGFVREAGGIRFLNRHGDTVLVAAEHTLTPKAVYRYAIDGEPVLRTKHTANGDVAYIENSRQEPDGFAFHGRLGFRVARGEHLYGLGQHEDGLFDYRGRREYLYQTNMKITVPFLLSSRNYGLLIDTETAMVFDEHDGAMAFDLETVTALSYYVIVGDSFDGIIFSLRTLTGRAPMLPRWAFGYVQSKERYRSAAELVETAEAFRARNIPVDCIVQDWHTWEAGLWGEKRPDPKRYPDLKALVAVLHRLHVKLMVSIWPNMAAAGDNYREFEESGLMLPNASVYNAFQEAGRALYWKQCEEAWFRAGIDAWWCDNAEPFSDADWNGAEKRPEELRYRLIVADSEKSMDWTRLNTYGLYHARGIYENWRRQTEARRVVNLTRSTYASGQRYGVVAWSGDLSAKWSVLKAQIAEGIKFCMSGQPYWTLDIGGFFTVKDRYENRGCDQAGNPAPLWFWNGDYNDGADDLGYRELYVRWLQFAVFLPMFRAHGTDTPREPWRFGQPGEPFYEAIVAFIRLRYRLLPYVYATAAAVSFRHGTMLRSLMFDFPQDERVAGLSDCFLFGRALLVCPVTEPMAYGPGSAPLRGVRPTRSVYLPAGCVWYDFWTNRALTGGRDELCAAPLERIPLFVRAGAIVPVSEPLAYADERGGEASVLYVYDGADGAFTLYNDAGDGYGYERGEYAMTPVSYSCCDQTLTLGRVEGSYPCQAAYAVMLVTDGCVRDCGVVRYQGEETTVRLA